MDNWTRTALDRYQELVRLLHKDRPLEVAQEDARVVLIAAQMDKLGTRLEEASRRLQT